MARKIAKRTSGKPGKPHRSAASTPRRAAPRKKAGGKRGITIIDRRPVAKEKFDGKKPEAAALDRAGRSKAAEAGKAKTQPAGGKGVKAGKAGAEGKATLRGKKGRTVVEAASDVKADAKGYVFINGRRVRMITTKPGAAAKKPRSNHNAALNSVPADTIPIKSIKTKLSKPELNHYRDLLLTKRRELVGDLSAMENEALRSGGGNLSHMPIHMADIGTDTYDQDFMLGLAANERQQLREIDGALLRIQDRTYGVCQLTGKPIPKARLDAKPWAKYTIEAARMIEGQLSR